MKTALFSGFIFLCCVNCVCDAEERTAEQAKAAKDFKFEGLTFATSIAELKKLHHNAKNQEDRSDKKLKIEQYVVPSEAANLVIVCFFEGKLYEMFVFYENDKLSKIGGDDVLIERLEKKFGKFDEDSPGKTSEDSPELQLYWRIKEANRLVILNSNEETTTITVTDTEIYARMIEAKKKAADVGF